MIYSVYAVKSDGSEMRVSEVEADTQEEAERLADAKVFFRSDETCSVRPHEPGTPRIVLLTRLKDFRQDSQTHNIPLGTVVHVKEFHKCYDARVGLEHGICIRGEAYLYVVEHGRDCDGTPLYGLSSMPVTPPKGVAESMRYRVFAFYDFGYSEDSFEDAGVRKDVRSWADYMRDLRGE